MTKADLVSDISDKTGVERIAVQAAVEAFMDSIKDSLEKGETSYTSNLGLEKLRKSIGRYVSHCFEIDYDSSSEILVTVGVSEALDLACRALINPGDEVIYHEPCYVSYDPSIRLAYGVPVPVSATVEDGFSVKAEEIEKLVDALDCFV